MEKNGNSDQIVINPVGEQSSVKPEPVDMQQVSQRRIEDLDARIASGEMWGENTSDLKEERQGHLDMLDHLSRRDYTDSNGNIHDAETGQFRSREQANTRPDPETPFKTIEAMSGEERRKAWVDAKKHGDKTTQLDIEDHYIDYISSLEIEEKSKYNLIGLVIRALDDEYEKSEETDLPPDETLGDEGEKSEVSDLPPAETLGDEGEKSEVSDLPPAETLGDEGEKSEVSDLPPAETLGDEGEKSEVSDLPPAETLGDEGEKSEDIEDTTQTNPDMENEPTIPPTTEELIARAELDLNDAVEELARQLNIQSKFFGKILHRREKEINLANAQERVRDITNQLFELRAEQIQTADNFAELARTALSDTIQQYMEEFHNLERNLDSAVPSEEQVNRIVEINALLNLYNGQLKDLIEQQSSRQGELEAFRADTVLQIARATADARIRQRIERRPILSRTAEWINQHPKARIGASLGLMAMGIVGAATLNAPLVTTAIAGKTALRTVGTYNFSRGIGETIVDRRTSRTQVRTIEQLFDLQEANVGTERRSKITGTLLSGIAALTPFLVHVLDAHQTPQINKPNVVSPKAPIINPVAQNTLPWNYGMNTLHTNISDPKILDSIVNNKYGIKFTGNGLGGGRGAITSVTIGNRMFTDLGHINGAIGYILGGGK